MKACVHQLCYTRTELRNHSQINGGASFILTSFNKTETCSLVNKSPDDRQSIQHQTVHVLFFPPWLVRAPASPGRSDRIPGTNTPRLRGFGVLHSPELPARRCRVVHVAVLSAYAAVPHGAAAHQALPRLDRTQLFYSQMQNPCEAPAGTESNPGGYYHIIEMTRGDASGQGVCRPSCYPEPSASEQKEATEFRAAFNKHPPKRELHSCVEKDSTDESPETEDAGNRRNLLYSIAVRFEHNDTLLQRLPISCSTRCWAWLQ